ncbi:MAG: hypothetical protein VYA21_06730 [Verrucomicrobiota bacterium]|nr:hypothetical protein [Verrucomicrobiota bacterium]
MKYSLSDTLNEATAKRKGHLKTLNLALLAYTAVILLLAIPSIIIKEVGGETGAYAVGTLFIDLVIRPLLLHPIGIGLLYLGVIRARDGEVRVKSIFGHYSKVWSLYAAFIVCLISYTVFGVSVALVIAIISTDLSNYALIGFIVVLAILIAVYAGYLINFTWLLILDKGLSVLSAYKYSIQTMRQWRNFWLLFKLNLMYAIWLFLGAFTLGVAYFWTIPRFMIAYGIVYRGLFDAESNSLIVDSVEIPRV